MSEVIRVVKIKSLLNPLREFLKDSRSGGVLLILCTIASLVISNLSGVGEAYINFWQQSVHFPGVHLPETPVLWINDVLMTFFFLLVGMEIRRELTIGELASVKKSLLPILGALGGMLVPAFFFFLFNGNTPFSQGWGIPMATDIAFSLGVLSLLGKRVPVQLKIFLVALAIIDDLGAVVTIAIFYTAKLNLIYLTFGGGVFALACFMNYYLKVKKLAIYAILGVALWFCLFNSGIHATISGVLMAFAIPMEKLGKLEHYLVRPSTFIIMPLFALANTAIGLPSEFGPIFSSSISFGIIAGLFLGKPIGIFLFSFLATKLRIASMPSGTRYNQLFGVAILGGIGFTMSIFTSNLAYVDSSSSVISKVAVICGSVLAAVVGYIYLAKIDNSGKTEIITSESTGKAFSASEKQPKIVYQETAMA